MMLTACALAIIFEARAQSCDNAITNGTFENGLTGWTRPNSTLTPHWEVSSGEASFLNSSSTAPSNTTARQLDQIVNNVAVEDGYITVRFNASLEKLFNVWVSRLDVYWGSTMVLRLNNPGSATPTTAVAYGGATVELRPGPYMHELQHACITLRIPYVGTAPANGTLSFRAPFITGERQKIKLDNVFIPRHGGCNTLSADQPVFTCEPGFGYLFQNQEAVGFNNAGPCNVYRVNLATGASTEVYPMLINTASNNTFTNIQAIGYNPKDNYIWGYRNGTGQLVRVGSDWSVKYVSIPGLANASYNSGDVDANGIYYLSFNAYSTATTNTIIERIDLNTGQLLQPLIVPLGIHGIDLAINPVDGYLYMLNYVDFGGTNEYQLTRISTTDGTGTVVGTYSTAQLGNREYGAGFFDGEGNYYVSENTLGRIFRFSTVQGSGTPVLTFMANGPQTKSNDGARCPYTPVVTNLVTGKVWNDANGNAAKDASGEPYVNTGTTNLNGLWANLVNAAGEVVASVPVQTDGTYTLYTNTNGLYSIILTNEEKSLNTPLSASDPLNNDWENTGTNVGGIADNTNRTGIITGVDMTGSDLANLDFGIQRLPTADPKAFNVAESAFGTTAPAVTGYKSIPMSSTEISNPAYPAGLNGSLSGSDPEDCADPSTCKTGTGTTFNIESIKSNTKLYYDFGAGPVEIHVTGGPVVIENFDVTKMTIYGQTGAGTVGNELGFTYSITDKAAATSAAVPYAITTVTALPVKLLNFNAATENNSVQAKWSTTEESNSDYFEVQHSMNASTWKVLGKVNADGESVVTRNYNYTHTAPTMGLNYYRLKMVDKDGTFAYSSIASTKLQEGVGKPFIFPNPTSGVIKLDQIDLEKVEKVELMNADGKVIYEATKITNDGINVKGLVSNGLYILKVSHSDGSLSVHKVVVGD